MKVSEAWTDGYTGNGVMVAILDDGLQTDHPDLDDNVVKKHLYP
jgi:furin